MDVPDIVIPEDLRPEDGRFGSGPSKVRPEAVADLAAVADRYLGISHRREPVKAVVRRIRAGIVDLYGLPEGWEVVLGNGGATAFWDAAVFGLIRRRSHHLTFGEFSTKFLRAVEAAPHLEASATEASPGDHPPLPDEPEGDVLALTHNETSTGVTMSPARPSGYDGLVVVDGTSAAGALPVNVADADVYYFSPQKAFGAEGGLWVAWLSPAAQERVAELAAGRYVPPFLSLSIALENARKDQTYNTPALATLYLLAHSIDWMRTRGASTGGGLAFSHGRVTENASILYGWAEATAYTTPFVRDPSKRSPVTATIDLDETVHGPTVTAILRANGIVDIEPYRKLGRNQIRVGLWPAIEPDDVAALTRCIDHVVERLV